MSSEPFIAAFAATAVEFFETVVIAYAVIRLGHWKEAAWAVLLAHVFVGFAAVFLYQLHSQIPVEGIRLVASLLLLATGGYWTIKSWKRLRARRRPRWVDNPIEKLGVDALIIEKRTFSIVVFLVMTKSALIEAVEITVFVLPTALAAQAGLAALAGCAAAIAAVLIVAALAHTQLRNVPEVKLKLGAGLVLTSLGIVWLVEFFLDSGLSRDGADFWGVTV